MSALGCILPHPPALCTASGHCPDHSSLRSSAQSLLSCPPLPLPACCRSDQILRFRGELSFLVEAGQRADMQRWYKHAARATQQSAEGGDATVGEEPLAPSIDSDSADSATAAVREGGGSRADSASAASFLAAALEGSSNSSRLDAKLAVSGVMVRGGVLRRLSRSLKLLGVLIASHLTHCAVHSGGAPH